MRLATFQSLAFLSLTAPALAQAPRPTTTQTAARVPAPTRPMDSLLTAGLRWRELGPFRGGRSVAVAGSKARPNEYWMGTTGGGV